MYTRKPTAYWLFHFLNPLPGTSCGLKMCLGRSAVGDFCSEYQLTQTEAQVFASKFSIWDQIALDGAPHNLIAPSLLRPSFHLVSTSLRKLVAISAKVFRRMGRFWLWR